MDGLLSTKREIGKAGIREWQLDGQLLQPILCDIGHHCCQPGVSCFIINFRFWVVVYFVKKRWLTNAPNWLKRLLEKIKYFFLFAIYIRIFIEAQQMMLISSYAELLRSDTSSMNKRVSLIIALVQVSLTILFCILIFVTWISLISETKRRNTIQSKKRATTIENESIVNHKKHWTYLYMSEMFSGLSDKFKSKIFYFISCLRSVIITFLMVATENLYVLISCQWIVIVVVCLIMPLSRIHENIIEVQNELCFLLLLLLLIHFDSVEKWAYGFGLGEEKIFR